MSPASPDPATQVGTAFDAGERSTRLRVALIWGVVFGLLQAAAPLGLWWIPPATVYAISLALIAAVYIGFAVADGRKKCYRRRSQRRDRFRSGRGGRCDRLIVGRGCRTGWAWRQGPVAAPHRIREQHPLVAAVLRHRRLRRRRNRGRRDSGRRRLRLTRPAIMPSRAAIKATRPQTRPIPASSLARAADRPSHHRYVGLATDTASGPAGA